MIIDRPKCLVRTIIIIVAWGGPIYLGRVGRVGVICRVGRIGIAVGTEGIAGTIWIEGVADWRKGICGAVRAEGIGSDATEIFSRLSRGCEGNCYRQDHMSAARCDATERHDEYSWDEKLFN